MFTNHVPLQCLQGNVVQGCLASAIFLPQVGTESKKQSHVPEIMFFGGLEEGIRPAESEPAALDLIDMLEVVLLKVDLQFFPIFCQTCWVIGMLIFPEPGHSLALAATANSSPSSNLQRPPRCSKTNGRPSMVCDWARVLILSRTLCFLKNLTIPKNGGYT